MASGGKTFFSNFTDNQLIKVRVIIIIIIIIIITNVKIKVMLSRKRCRGTLQEYNKA